MAQKDCGTTDRRTGELRLSVSVFGFLNVRLCSSGLCTEY